MVRFEEGGYSRGEEGDSSRWFEREGYSVAQEVSRLLNSRSEGSKEAVEDDVDRSKTYYSGFMMAVLYLLRKRSDQELKVGMGGEI